MRTEQEIEALVERADDEVLSFVLLELLPYLPLDKAARFISLLPSETLWAANGWPKKQDSEAIERAARQYMEFAWAKALEHRGLSARSNIEKFTAWMFLLGQDDLVLTCGDKKMYRYYGAPILAAICGHMGWHIPKDSALQNMMNGRPCSEDCIGCREAV